MAIDEGYRPLCIVIHTILACSKESTPIPSVTFTYHRVYSPGLFPCGTFSVNPEEVD